MSEGKGGRPSKFEDMDLEKVRALAVKGWTDLEMSEFFEVAESTWYLWKNKHPGFSEVLKDWKDEADERVERSLYERALGYACKDTKFATHEGKIEDEREYTKHYPPDTTAAIFWLKNRKHEQWRDKRELDHGFMGDSDEQLDNEITRLLKEAETQDIINGEEEAEEST